MKTVNETTNKPENLVRYPLASAWRRIGAKVLDIFIISVVFTACAIAILATAPGFKWNEITYIESWRYILIGIIMLSLFVGLMYILPIFTDWTIGMKAAKLKYVHILPLSKKAGNLFKHEILIWGIMCILSFILCIILACLENVDLQKSLLEGIRTMGAYSKDIGEIKSKPLFYTGVTFACLYYGVAIVLLAVIIGLFVRNKKPTFYDKFSNIVVIHLKPINTPDKLHNKKVTPRKKINYGVPGEISTGSFEELDDLE